MTRHLYDEPKDTFTDVVLSGGGIKGLGQLGTLHFYHELGLFKLSDIDTYAATSIGSVIALLLICSYTPLEIFHEIYSINSFFNINSLNIQQSVKTLGLFSLDNFIDKIGTLVIKRFGKIPTLEEMYDETKQTLIAVATNETKMTPEYFTHTTHPHLLVLDAVRMSCSLPLICQRIKYRECHYIDGGILDNFPIHKIEKNRKILAIITMGKNIPEDDTHYLFRLISMPINMTTELRKGLIGPNTTLVDIEFDGVSLLDFSLTGEKKLKIFTKGYYEAEKQHRQRNWNTWDWNDSE